MRRAIKMKTEGTKRRLSGILCAMVLCGVGLTSCVAHREPVSSRYTTIFGEQVERTSGQFILLESRGWLEEEPSRPSYGGYGGGFPMPGFSFGVNTSGDRFGSRSYYEPGHN